MRFIGWTILWLLTLCTLKVDVLYSDGWHIQLNPFWEWRQKGGK